MSGTSERKAPQMVVHKVIAGVAMVCSMMVVTATTACARVHGESGTADSGEAVQQAVADAILAAGASVPGVSVRGISRSEVVLDTVPVIGAFVRSGTLLRGRVPSLPHSRTVLVWVAGKRFWRLGGFFTPQPVELVRDMNWRVGDLQSAAELGRQLANGLDDAGARSVLFPSQVEGYDSLPKSTVAVLHRAERAAGAPFPSDTVVRLSNGDVLVRTTSLSLIGNPPAQAWRRSMFVFLFRDGWLVTWAVSHGEEYEADEEGEDK
jgi:hypothetical protein